MKFMAFFTPSYSTYRFREALAVAIAVSIALCLCNFFHLQYPFMMLLSIIIAPFLFPHTYMHVGIERIVSAFIPVGICIVLFNTFQSILWITVASFLWIYLMGLCIQKKYFSYLGLLGLITYGIMYSLLYSQPDEVFTFGTWWIVNMTLGAFILFVVKQLFIPSKPYPVLLFEAHIILLKSKKAFEGFQKNTSLGLEMHLLSRLNNLASFALEHEPKKLEYFKYWINSLHTYWSTLLSLSNNLDEFPQDKELLKFETDVIKLLSLLSKKFHSLAIHFERQKYLYIDSENIDLAFESCKNSLNSLRINKTLDKYSNDTTLVIIQTLFQLKRLKKTLFKICESQNKMIQLPFENKKNQARTEKHDWKFTNRELIENIRIPLGILLTILLCESLGLSESTQAMITVTVILVQPNIGKAALQGSMRLIGILIGACLGLIISSIITQMSYFWMLISLYVPSIFLFHYLGYNTRFGYIWIQASLALTLLLTFSDSNAFNYSIIFERIVGCIIGILISITLISFILPRHPLEGLRTQIAYYFQECKLFLTELKNSKEKAYSNSKTFNQLEKINDCQSTTLHEYLFVLGSKKNKDIFFQKLLNEIKNLYIQLQHFEDQSISIINIFSTEQQKEFMSYYNKTIDLCENASQEILLIKVPDKSNEIDPLLESYDKFITSFRQSTTFLDDEKVEELTSLLFTIKLVLKKFSNIHSILYSQRKYVSTFKNKTFFRHS